MDIKFIFGVGMIVSGLGYCAYTFFMSLKVKECLNWPSVAGTITHSEVIAESTNNYQHHNRVFVAKIEYDYNVKGSSFHGDKIALGGEFNTSFKQKAEDRCEMYQVGSIAQVYYDPNDPKRCCLEQTMEGALFRYSIGGGFAFIGLLLVSGIIGG